VEAKECGPWSRDAPHECPRWTPPDGFTERCAALRGGAKLGWAGLAADRGLFEADADAAAR
jgi:hypothetical protein